MTHSFYVLFAAGAMGAPGDGATAPSPAAPAPVAQYTQIVPEHNGGMRGWLRNVFNPKKTQPSVPAAQASGSIPCLANPAGPCAAVPVTTVTTLRPSYEVAPLAVAKKYEDRIGHEQNYSWITGHLFYVHADGGRWVVRYALPDEIDPFGGSVILAPGVEMRNFREGDLVCVSGDLLDTNRTSHSMGGALYRVNTISIVDRADP